MDILTASLLIISIYLTWLVISRTIDYYLIFLKTGIHSKTYNISWFFEILTVIFWFLFLIFK